MTNTNKQFAIKALKGRDTLSKRVLHMMEYDVQSAKYTTDWTKVQSVEVCVASMGKSFGVFQFALNNPEAFSEALLCRAGECVLAALDFVEGRDIDALPELSLEGVEPDEILVYEDMAETTFMAYQFERQAIRLVNGCKTKSLLLDSMVALLKDKPAKQAKPKQDKPVKRLVNAYELTAEPAKQAKQPKTDKPAKQAKQPKTDKPAKQAKQPKTDKLDDILGAIMGVSTKVDTLSTEVTDLGRRVTALEQAK